MALNYLNSYNGKSINKKSENNTIKERDIKNK